MPFTYTVIYNNWIFEWKKLVYLSHRRSVRSFLGGPQNVLETTLEQKNCLPRGSSLKVVPSEGTRRKNINIFFFLIFFPQSNRNTENIENIKKTNTYKTQ